MQTSKEFWVFLFRQSSSGPLRKHIFTCDWCISIHFVCFCFLRLVACDRPVSGNNRLVFFEYFSDHSYSCLLPLTKSPLIIAISFAILEQSGVILSFVFAGQARRVLCIVICINSAPTKMIDGTEKPIRSLQTINQATKKILAKIFLPKKITNSKMSNPQKSFDHPGPLEIWNTTPNPPPPLPPLPELKLQKVLKSFSFCELKE